MAKAVKIDHQNLRRIEIEISKLEIEK